MVCMINAPSPDKPKGWPSTQPSFASIAKPLLLLLIFVSTVTTSRSTPRVYSSYLSMSIRLFPFGGDGERRKLEAEVEVRDGKSQLAEGGDGLAVLIGHLHSQHAALGVARRWWRAGGSTIPSSTRRARRGSGLTLPTRTFRLSRMEATFLTNPILRRLLRA